MVHQFQAVIDIIGINPFVFVPDSILLDIFRQAGRGKGPIAIKGAVNERPYTQTLVKYKGAWRLYINIEMLENSPRRIGEEIRVSITYNPEPPEVTAPPAFLLALENDPEAKRVFDNLPAYLKKEISRYLYYLKTEKSLNRNIARALNFLRGKERFIGRDKP